MKYFFICYVGMCAAFIFGGVVGTEFPMWTISQQPTTAPSTLYKYELMFATTSTLQWIGEYTDQNEMLSAAYSLWDSTSTDTLSNGTITLTQSHCETAEGEPCQLPPGFKVVTPPSTPQVETNPCDGQFVDELACAQWMINTNGSCANSTCLESIGDYMSGVIGNGTLWRCKTACGALSGCDTFTGTGYYPLQTTGTSTPESEGYSDCTQL